MYDADIIEKLYQSDLAGAAIGERPDGLAIILIAAMSMSAAHPPVLLFRSALHQMNLASTAMPTMAASFAPPTGRDPRR